MSLRIENGVTTDGEIATTSECGQERSLALNDSSARAVFEHGQQSAGGVIVVAAFNGQSTLADLRQHDLRFEHLGDPIDETYPSSAGDGGGDETDH